MPNFTLHPPFIISARLAPGIQIQTDEGIATLSLLGTGISPDGSTVLGQRQTATLVLDFPDGTSYEDDRMQSGCGGFNGVVTVFETFFGFLMAAVESYEFEQRHPGSEGENTGLFPRHIVEWASANKYSLESAHCDIQDPATGDANETLIEVAA